MLNKHVIYFTYDTEPEIPASGLRSVVVSRLSLIESRFN